MQAAAAAVSLPAGALAYANGDKMAEDLDYVPLPSTVEDTIRQQWSRITDASGVRVLAD